MKLGKADQLCRVWARLVVEYMDRAIVCEFLFLLIVCGEISANIHTEAIRILIQFSNHESS